jgi:hypothetical protein
MSFNSRDLMIDVLPRHRFDDPARGFALCGQVTAITGNDEGDDEPDGGKCTQVTATTTNDPTAATRDGLDLALLQRQMRAALAAGTAAGA